MSLSSWVQKANSPLAAGFSLKTGYEKQNLRNNSHMLFSSKVISDNPALANLNHQASSSGFISCILSTLAFKPCL